MAASTAARCQEALISVHACSLQGVAACIVMLLASRNEACAPPACTAAWLADSCMQATAARAADAAGGWHSLDPCSLRVLHSAAACAQPGIVGIAEVVREAYPDHTAGDASSAKYDAKHTADSPKWFMVDVKLVRGPCKDARLRPAQDCLPHARIEHACMHAARSQSKRLAHATEV